MDSDLYSSGSSGLHRVDSKQRPPPDEQPLPPKFTPEQSLEFEALGPRPRSSFSPPRYVRYGRAFGLDHPRVRKFWHYLRGPRPQVDLPGTIVCLLSRVSKLTCSWSSSLYEDPMPILNRSYTFKCWSFRLVIETALLRATRPFTSPWLFTILAIGYIISFAFFSRAQSFLTPADSFIDCTATYWTANNGCGLDGELCAPFDNSTFDFRCPAQCSSVILQNPRTVGGEQVDFVPLIVGGGDTNHTYRGDSFICAAAVQA